METFSERTMEFFRRAMLSAMHDGDADAVGTAGDSRKGNLIRIALWVRAGRIEQASARTFGCVPAIAAGCALCETLRGASLEDARRIGKLKLIAILGGLPKERRYCADLAIEALRNALNSLGDN